MKVILQGYILVNIEELPVVMEALELHKQLTLAETGCLTFQVTPCSKIQGKFDVYEEFINMKSFEKHQERVKNSQWGKVSAHVERHYQSVCEVAPY